MLDSILGNAREVDPKEFKKGADIVGVQRTLAYKVLE